MKKSVGLVVLAKVPQEDGKEILMAVLQRRGRWNTEKMAPESYPGCCQVTCHGKVEECDTGEPNEFYNALIRESREELGFDFTKRCQLDIPLLKLVKVTTSEKEVITFGALVPADRIKLIRLGPDSGGLDLITYEAVDNIVSITPEMKKNGPEYTYTRAMFPDEIEAVRKAFEVFGNK